MFYRKVRLELDKISRRIQKIEQKIKQSPKGELFVCQNGKYYKWYCSIKNKATYIPKKNRAFAEQLFEKKYYTTLLEDTLREKKALEAYLKAYGSNSLRSETLINTPKYEELIPAFYKPLKDRFSEWMSEKFEQNPYYPEKKTVKGVSSQYFRSKSEATIAKALYLRGIPYRYECALSLGNKTYYPDFMILHPVTGELFIWEHYGFMDSPSYVRRKLQQIETYISHGFFPMVNFIATFEDYDHPLDFTVVDRLIETYLS